MVEFNSENKQNRHDTILMTLTSACAHGHRVTLHPGKTLTPFSILIKPQATQYLYSKFRGYLSEIPHLSHP